MSNHPEATSVSDLVALIDDATDVRAALERGEPPLAPSLLPEIKREIDRLVYADRTRAARLVEAADWAASRLGDHASRAFADASRARLLYAEARYVDAEPLFDAASAVLLEAGFALDAAALAKQHLETLMYLGRYDDAFRLAREARRTLERSGDRRLLAEHETNVGNLHYRLDAYRKALGCYERAHVIFAELGDPVPLAYLSHNRATALVDLDRPDEALRHYADAAEAYRKFGLDTLALQVDLAVAYVEYLKGHYYEALRRFHAAQEAGRGALNDADVALTDLDLAAVYLHLNSLDEADGAARRAANGFTRLGMIGRELGNARRLSGVAAAKRGDAASAAAIFEEVAALFDRAEHPVQAALTRTQLAAALLCAGRWEAALDAARDAGAALGRERLGARRRYARLLEARALHGLGAMEEAASVASATLRAARRAGDDWIAFQCRHLLARARAAGGRRAAALRAFRDAIDDVERLRSRIVVDDFKTKFLEDKVDLFEDAVALCLESGKPELVDEALRTLELAKSRSLSDLLADYVRERAPGSESGREARERFRRLVDELAWYGARRGQDADEPPSGEGTRREALRRSREVESREARVAEAFRRLQVEDPRFAELQRPRVVAAGELRQMVGEREALVEYARTGGRYSAIVVTRDGSRALRDIASVDDVDRLLDGFRFQTEKFAFGREYAEREIGHLRRGADLYLASLYDALLRPLEPLVDDRALVVVPHGRLHYVPFHALLDGAAYVVERRGVSYAPSATVYALCAAARQSADTRRASGPPLVCGVADASAPEIDREIEALRTLFPDARVLAGAEATRAAVARHAENSRILHVASHARFRADNPMLSSLRLADGDLTFYDVYALNLSAELVVLSGCNTGAVTVGAGDELHGLMRGFLYAGAPSLLMSMWAADDAATARLMHDFYTEFLGGATKRDALRAAQRAALERHAHPYYWAPFSLIGGAS